MKKKIKSRGLAAFVGMETDQEPEIMPDGFVFELSESVGEWERRFVKSKFKVYDQYLLSYGDEQRRIREHKTNT